MEKQLLNNGEVVQEEVVKMELFPEDAEYRDLAQAAKQLNIPYVGVNKVELREKLNAMINKINNGEAEVPETESTYVDEVEEGEVQGQVGNEGDNSTPRRRQSTGRVKGPKWYEEDGAFPYAEGDIVEIVSGKDLIGRKVMVKQPSAKKNALKGHLIHPTTGELQKTFLSVDFDRVELREKAGQPVDQKVDSKELEEAVV